MIDWSKLKTYEGNKYRSFEELCYQISKVIYERKDVLLPLMTAGVATASNST